jgi:hypothetical protein
VRRGFGKYVLTVVALAFGLVFLSRPALPQATQCIANVAAQGTGDAITSAALPCGTTTNMVILTTSAGNVTTTPTYQPLGSPALPIVRAGGGALSVGDLTAGYVALLTSTGTSWVLINPANAFTNSLPSSAVLMSSLPGTGVLSPTLAQWGNDFFVNVMNFCTPTQASTDITACAGAALTYLESIGTTSYGRGELFFPAQYSPYKLLGQLVVTGSFINLVGEGASATYLNCFSTTLNCIQLGQSSGTQTHNLGIRDLSVNVSGAVTTTGDNIEVINTSQAIIQNIDASNCYVCVEVTQNSNTTTVQNANLFAQQAAAVAGVYFHDSANGSSRSDELNLNNVNINGTYGQGSGIIQDGQASTINMSTVTTVDFVHGWWVKNSAESATYFPSFSNVFNFQPQANSAEAIEIDAGSAWIISDSAIANGPGSGATTAHCAVLINPDTGYSVTKDVQISNSRIANAGQCGVSDAAQTTQLSNIVFAGIGLETANTYSSIVTGATAIGAHYSNITCETQSTNAEYCVNIASGATNTTLSGIDGTNVTTAAVNDGGTNTSQCQIIPPGGGPAVCGVGSANPVTEGGVFSIRQDQNAVTTATIHNNSTGTGGKAVWEYSAGGTNNFGDVGQTGSGFSGALPPSAFFITLASGVVNGIHIDASGGGSAAPLDLTGGSSAGVVVSPSLTVSGCTGVMSGNGASPVTCGGTPSSETCSTIATNTTVTTAGCYVVTNTGVTVTLGAFSTYGLVTIIDGTYAPNPNETIDGTIDGNTNYAMNNPGEAVDLLWYPASSTWVVK